jgi:nuclear transport factor 2 (NTF2) superfamily protein
MTHTSQGPPSRPRTSLLSHPRSAQANEHSDQESPSAWRPDPGRRGLLVQPPELWAFDGNRVVVRFQYESRDQAGQWWRSYGNELWEFDNNGLMSRREPSINDIPIQEKDLRIFGPRTEPERQVLPPR